MSKSELARIIQRKALKDLGKATGPDEQVSKEWLGYTASIQEKREFFDYDVQGYIQMLVELCETPDDQVNQFIRSHPGITV